jgi:hypothetical protein
MKHLLLIVVVFACMSSYGQTGRVIINSRIFDAQTKEKIGIVRVGTQLEIVEKTGQYYTILYSGQNCLIPSHCIKIDQPTVDDGVKELPAEDQQKIINQSLIYTNYCLNKYRTEQLTGFWISVFGGGVAIVGAANGDNEITTVGGVISLGGGVIMLTSYRWLKKAYIYPIRQGVGVGLQINF